MHRYKLIIVLTAVISGCASPPETAQKFTWYETTHDLQVKADKLEGQTKSFIDKHGILMYETHLPLDDSNNYLMSHDGADTPAWQGCLMAAYGFKGAALKIDVSDDLEKLADGFLTYFEVTGQKGLLGRSIIPDYTGPRLSWMLDKEARPTRYWLQGTKGVWWRNGLAKNHLNLAMFGCSIPLALDRRGDLSLSDRCRNKLIYILVHSVKRLAHNDFQIIDWNGEPTEFGDLRPDIPVIGIDYNGFNMLISLHMLAAASHYDTNLKALYIEKKKEWSTKIKRSISLLAAVLRGIGHYRLGKPSYSDMAALYQAYLSLYLNLDNTKDTDFAEITQGMSNLWKKVLRYERNLLVTIPFLAATNQIFSIERLAMQEDLHDFPDEKIKHFGSERESSKTQPLANRPINSHYPKSDPNVYVNGPQKLSNIRFSAQDYLLSYYAAKYFKLLDQ